MHVPVLLREVLEILDLSPGEFAVDGTLGGGGHAREVLGRVCPTGRFLGVDADEDAVAEFRGEHGSCPEDRVKILEASYAELPEILRREGWGRADAVLLDLGLSSLQLEDAGRGFSLRSEGPLDMRFSRKGTRTAGEILHTASREELKRIFKEYGEERFAGRIASAIVGERSKGRIRTTTELADIVSRAVPRGPKRLHPATRVFQALRIAVNGELENLETFLDSLSQMVAPGGRVAIISFHSLEDRIVKTRFRRFERFGKGEVLTKKPVVAGEKEREENPRSRSAKLRGFRMKA